MCVCRAKSICIEHRTSIHYITMHTHDNSSVPCSKATHIYDIYNYSFTSWNTPVVMCMHSNIYIYVFGGSSGLDGMIS